MSFRTEFGRFGTNRTLYFGAKLTPAHLHWFMLYYLTGVTLWISIFIIIIYQHICMGIVLVYMNIISAYAMVPVSTRSLLKHYAYLICQNGSCHITQALKHIRTAMLATTILYTDSAWLQLCQQLLLFHIGNNPCETRIRILALLLVSTGESCGVVCELCHGFNITWILR